MRKSLTEYVKDLYGKGNDRGISLFLVPGKIFGKISIEKIKETMTSKMWELQGSSMLDRCADQIFCSSTGH